MLSCKVKASQVTNLTDARYYAAWEVDWIGFCLDPGYETSITREAFHAMRDWLEGPAITAEFFSLPADDILGLLPDLSVDAIQLGPFYTLTDAEKLSEHQLLKLLVIDQETSFDQLEATLEEHRSVIETFILDFSRNGISWNDLEDHPEFDHNALLDLCSQFPILLSVDLDPNQLQEMLRQTKAYGINLYGGEEEAVGVKSFDEIDELIEILYVEH
ncbi:MAG: N-(5'-phosphoribosyl)anthranilate isomerase [Bacteroidota bacterium]